jgi:hypothetical protein
MLWKDELTDLTVSRAAGNNEPALTLYEKAVSLGVDRAEQNVRNVSLSRGSERQVYSLLHGFRSKPRSLPQRLKRNPPLPRRHKNEQSSSHPKSRNLYSEDHAGASNRSHTYHSPVFRGESAILKPICGVSLQRHPDFTDHRSNMRRSYSTLIMALFRTVIQWPSCSTNRSYAKNPRSLVTSTIVLVLYRRHPRRKGAEVNCESEK